MKSTKKEAMQSLKSISLMNIDAKIINKIFTNRVNNVLREYYVMTKQGLFQKWKYSNISGNRPT